MRIFCEYLRIFKFKNIEYYYTIKLTNLMTMTTYICPRCHLSTGLKSNFKRHLFRKHSCRPLYSDLSINDIAKSYDIRFLNPNESKMNPNESKMNPYESILNPNGSNKCEYCKKQYSTNSNLHKHYKRCKKFKEYKENKFKKEYELQKKENELKRLTKIINNLLKQTKNNNVISTKNKLINNKNKINTQINNTQNNNNQQVKINNFGEEDMSYITPEKSKNLLIDPRNSITNLIDDTHFNLDHPENANIRIPNKKQPFIELYVDNAWKVFNQYKTVCEILKNKKEFIHDLFIKQQNELTPKQKTDYLDYKELLDRDLFMVKQVLTDVRASIISGTRSNPKIKEFQNNLIKRNNIDKDPMMKLLEQIPEDFLYENDSDSDSDIN